MSPRQRDWTSMLVAGLLGALIGVLLVAGLGLALAGLALVAETALRAMLEVVT